MTWNLHPSVRLPLRFLPLICVLFVWAAVGNNAQTLSPPALLWGYQKVPKPAQSLLRGLLRFDA